MTASSSSLSAPDVRRLEAHHRELLDLCIQLEEAAGELETSAVRTNLDALADTIPAMLAKTHEFEEQRLFPDFDRNAGSCFAAMMIEQLKAEHRCDRLGAKELSLTLKALAKGRCALGLDTIAYMIRGFQECLRRHIAAERLMIETLLVAEAEGREALA